MPRHLLGILTMAFMAAAATQDDSCPSYTVYSTQRHEPFSEGRYQLSYQRPSPECRKITIPEVEGVITNMKNVIQDPDLFRLFQNCFPNTLDTAIAWTGFSADNAEEELTMITTGDINAMWLRDSANQLRSYKSLLESNQSSGSLASLFRGAINLQARFILAAPHCNAFQAPPESGLPTQSNGFADIVFPAYNNQIVFECKYELDSLAAFLQLSSDYYTQTKDADFFAKYHGWTDAVNTILNVTKALLVGTYDKDGSVIASPYTFQRTTSSSTETLSNHGNGEPVKDGSGLIRSAFRPSDDSCIYQLFIPANMMFSTYLSACSEIMDGIDQAVAADMREFAASIRAAIDQYGKVTHPKYGEMYAYEVDGFGSHNLMDDANIPSLLSAPVITYLENTDQIYRNTREFILSSDNPYFMRGDVLSAVGGPHVGPGMAWPMAAIVRILTSDDDNEIIQNLGELLASTDGLGLIHESIKSNDANTWTRQWFSWANGLFGQMILDLKERKPHILSLSFQGGNSTRSV